MLCMVYLFTQIIDNLSDRVAELESTHVTLLEQRKHENPIIQYSDTTNQDSTETPLRSEYQATVVCKDIMKQDEIGIKQLYTSNVLLQKLWQ